MAPVYETEANALADYEDWGPAQEEIEALAAQSATNAGLLFSIANNPDRSPSESWDAFIETGQTGAAASAARLALGLPLER